MSRTTARLLVGVAFGVGLYQLQSPSAQSKEEHARTPNIPSIPHRARLETHPENPRYFLDTRTGRAVVLTGYGSLVPTSDRHDDAALLREMQANLTRYARVWHFLPWEGSRALWPWQRSRSPGAHLGGHGGNKLDLDTWEPDYWNRLRRSLARSDEVGVQTELLIFDRCGMSPPGDDRWGNNPWASDNNVNRLETPSSSEDGVPAFYRVENRPRLRQQQERYLRKLVDSTLTHPNVIYEIENEHTGDRSPEFGRRYARLLKGYLAERYPGVRRLVSYSSLQSDLEEFFTIPEVDIVNRHFGREAERNPDQLNAYLEPRWPRKKPINVDEFANGVIDFALLRRMCWTILTSGGHFHIEDAAPAAQPLAVVQNIQKFLRTSGWNFLRSAPQKRLVTSGNGYCMAEPGVEYVLYAPHGGTVKVELVGSREYRAAWWDPRQGQFQPPLTFQHEGGHHEFTAPSTDDWVLRIKARSTRSRQNRN